jgi:hypothetical protein
VCACEKTVVMVKQPNERGQEKLICWGVLRTRAFNIHEVGVGGLYKALKLVLTLFKLGRGVEEVDGESLGRALAIPSE